MKITTQKGWDELTDSKGRVFYRKRGITNGAVEVTKREGGWLGEFLPADDSLEYHRTNDFFPDTYTGIIECKIAISTWHGRKYVITKYESHSQIIRSGGKKEDKE